MSVIYDDDDKDDNCHDIVNDDDNIVDNDTYDHGNSDVSITIDIVYTINISILRHRTFTH